MENISQTTLSPEKEALNILAESFCWNAEKSLILGRRVEETQSDSEEIDLMRRLVTMQIKESDQFQDWCEIGKAYNVILKMNI